MPHGLRWGRTNAAVLHMWPPWGPSCPWRWGHEFFVLPLRLLGEYQVAFERFYWDMNQPAIPPECSWLTQGSFLEWHCLLCGCSSKKDYCKQWTVPDSGEAQVSVCGCRSGWPAGCLPEPIRPSSCGLYASWGCHLLELRSARPSTTSSRAAPFEAGHYKCVCIWVEWGRSVGTQQHHTHPPDGAEWAMEGFGDIKDCVDQTLRSNTSISSSLGIRLKLCWDEMDPRAWSLTQSFLNLTLAEWRLGSCLSSRAPSLE